MRLGLLHSPFLTPTGSWGEIPQALEALGHEVVVVDADAAKSPKEYARAAAEQLGPQPVVLIAHGDAGMLVPLVAARRDHGWIPSALFLDAVLPGISGESWLTTLRRRDPAGAVEVARRLYEGGSWPDPAGPGWLGLDVHVRGLAHLTEPIQVPSAGRDYPHGYLRLSPGWEPSAIVAERAGHSVLRRDLDPFAQPREVAAAIGDLLASAAQVSTQAPPVG